MNTLLAIALLAEIAAPITVEVGNVRNDRGQVHVAFCTRDQFLGKSCPYEASAPARAGVTVVTVPDVPAGDYAAQSFHDENGNKEIDRALFGIPREGVGFSRDAKIRMGPPKWAEAVFTHGTQPQSIHFALRYFLGAGGPVKGK